MHRILLIEDDAKTQPVVSVCSVSLGASLETIAEPNAPWENVLRANWDLVLLAATIPQVDGWSLLRLLRSASRVPVLLLVATGNDIDGILGLELGADVYLTKPVNARALLAQMRALLRRAGNERQSVLPPAPLQCGELELDEHTHIARYAGQRLELTSSEFELMRLLLRAKGEVLSRELLSEQLLGRPFAPTDRSLDVHVSNLRRKLGSVKGQAGTRSIRAVRGIGYALSLR